VGILARFVGGPLDGQERELPGLMNWVSVAMEPEVEHTVFSSDIVVKQGLYQRDGLPNLSPYVYSWRGPR
jgi:hypothetical protein